MHLVCFSLTECNKQVFLTIQLEILHNQLYGSASLVEEGND